LARQYIKTKLFEDTPDYWRMMVNKVYGGVLQQKPSENSLNRQPQGGIVTLPVWLSSNFVPGVNYSKEFEELQESDNWRHYYMWNKHYIKHLLARTEFGIFPFFKKSPVDRHGIPLPYLFDLDSAAARYSASSHVGETIETQSQNNFPLESLRYVTSFKEIRPKTIKTPISLKLAGIEVKHVFHGDGSHLSPHAICELSYYLPNDSRFIGDYWLVLTGKELGYYWRNAPSYDIIKFRLTQNDINETINSQSGNHVIFDDWVHGKSTDQSNFENNLGKYWLPIPLHAKIHLTYVTAGTPNNNTDIRLTFSITCPNLLNLAMNIQEHLYTMNIENLIHGIPGYFWLINESTDVMNYVGLYTRYKMYQYTIDNITKLGLNLNEFLLPTQRLMRLLAIICRLTPFQWCKMKEYGLFNDFTTQFTKNYFAEGHNIQPAMDQQRSIFNRTMSIVKSTLVSKEPWIYKPGFTTTDNPRMGKIINEYQKRYDYAETRRNAGVRNLMWHENVILDENIIPIPGTNVNRDNILQQVWIVDFFEKMKESAPGYGEIFRNFYEAHNQYLRTASEYTKIQDVLISNKQMIKKNKQKTDIRPNVYF
jgi:hypothetical protein